MFKADGGGRAGAFAKAGTILATAAGEFRAAVLNPQHNGEEKSAVLKRMG